MTKGRESGHDAWGAIHRPQRRRWDRGEFPVKRLRPRPLPETLTGGHVSLLLVPHLGVPAMMTGRIGLTPRRARRPANTSRRPPWRPEALEDRLTPANALLPDLQVLSSYLSGWTVNSAAGNGREIRYATALANG